MKLGNTSLCFTTYNAVFLLKERSFIRIFLLLSTEENSREPLEAKGSLEGDIYGSKSILLC